ncbi:MAG TPA: PAAR domain-containing protein [Stellaceae bacterium]|nr:PAAR domain-containing protein [Stellaceae bacterium]
MGQPAARVTDMHVCPMVTALVPHVGGPILPPGGITVLIGALPAARVSDLVTCAGPPDVIALGSMSVLIGGLPAARMGDMTAHGGAITLGCFTVLIS